MYCPFERYLLNRLKSVLTREDRVRRRKGCKKGEKNYTLPRSQPKSLELYQLKILFI